MNINAIREAAIRGKEEMDGLPDYCTHEEPEACAACGRVFDAFETILRLLDEAEPGEAAVEYGCPFDEPVDQERRGMLGWEAGL